MWNMEYVVYIVVIVLVLFIALFVVKFIKALKNPDVVIATKLGMTISVYRDCQETLEQQIAWHKTASQEDKENLKNVRIPKNIEAFRRYCTYMRYKSEVKEWEEDGEFMENPHEKEEYRWIKEAGL